MMGQGGGRINCWPGKGVPVRSTPAADVSAQLENIYRALNVCFANSHGVCPGAHDSLWHKGGNA